MASPRRELSTASFVPYKVKRRIPLERRPVPGSAFFEYRARVTLPLPPLVVFEHLWRHVAEATAVAVKRRQVLRRSESEVLVYDEIHAPVVSERDYTLRMARSVDSAGRLQVTFETANELGPPPRPHYVRVPIIRGRWTVESDGQGGTLLSQMNFSDPGGAIPAFMAHGPQSDLVVDGMIRVQEQLQKLLPASASAPPRQLGKNDREKRAPRGGKTIYGAAGYVELVELGRAESSSTSAMMRA
jgi:hypothetical protein